MKFSEYRARIEDGASPDFERVSVPKEARAMQGLRAGFFARALAVFIDIGIVALVIIAVNAALAFLQFVLNETTNWTVPKLAGTVMVGAGLLWVTWTISWSTTGRSVGMYIMGLRVVNHAGDRVRPAGAALRAIFCLGFPVGLLWALISRQNRSVQDIVLRTSVINDWVMGLPNLKRSPSP